MFKLLFRIVFLGIALLIAFVALSFWSGGEKIRWFGKKVEQGSEKAAETADRLKKTGDSVAKGIDRATEKVKDLTGQRDGKAR